MNETEHLSLFEAIRRHWNFLIPVAVAPQLCVIIYFCFHIPESIFRIVSVSVFLVSVVISGIPSRIYRAPSSFHTIGFVIAWIDFALVAWICRLCNCVPFESAE